MNRPLAFLLMAAASTLSAQSLTEKIDVSLVNVDVAVTTHGAPARGLTSADFEVLEDGVPQKVTNFYAIENARDKAAASAAPAAKVAEAPDPGDERFRRRVLVIVDNRHITRHDRDVALANLEQFMNQHFQEGAYDWSLAMITDRAHLLVPLTSDKARIHEALIGVRQAMAGRPVGTLPMIDDRIARSSSNPLDEENMHWSGATIGHADPAMNAAALNDMVENSNRFLEAGDAFATYDAITQLTRSFAVLPGRKIVLVLTEGFGDEGNPLPFGRGAYDAGLLTRALTAVRQRLVHDANASDASIYIIGTGGLKPINIGADTSSAAGYDATFGSGSAVTGGSIYWLAHETGGAVFTGNHIDESLRNFNEASSNFYSLAYHPAHGEDGKYHRISVRITRPGRYMLSYRDGYSSLPVGAQLQRAMASPSAAEMQRSTIPVTIAAGTVTDTKEGAAVPISIKVPAKSLQFISSGKESTALVDVFISVFNADGRLIADFSTAREAHALTGTESAGDFLEHESIRLRRNAAYKVVVAVHDQTTDAVGITSTVLTE